MTGGLLGDAITSPITLGILVGYVVGKPLGIVGASWLAYAAGAARAAARRSAGRCSPAAGRSAGIGFTVSLLISSLAFSGERLAEAKLGVLASAVLAPLVAWGVFRLGQTAAAAGVRARQIAGTAEDLLDLSEDVDPDRDHIRGADDALVTLLEYGDFECPYCGQAESVVRELLSSFGDDLRYVWRHLPLNDVHPSAQLAAEAAEAAAAQGRVLGDLRRAARPPGRARPRRTLRPLRARRSASTSSASGRSCATTSTRRGSPRTWRAPTRAASRGRRRSSSTDAATTAPTTSTR